MTGAHAEFTLVLALAVGVLAQVLSRRLRLPGIVLLLLAGAWLGPDGLGWVQPTALGDGLLSVVELSVAIILFEGGLNLEISRLRREGAPIRRLVLGGPLITMLGGAIAAQQFLGWDLVQALVFGSLVVVTGPTVVGPLIQELRLRPRVATVLEAEGVLIDPVGAILAVLLLEVALAPDADSLLGLAQVLVYRVGLGALAGTVAGFALAWLLRVRRLVPEGLHNITVLAAVLLLFEGCNQVLSQTGLLAVTIAGVVVGNLRSAIDRDLREFKDQLTVLLVGLLFVLLASAVRLDDVRSLGQGGLLVVAALIVAVRPLTVWLATMGSELNWRERVLVGWIAPRGIVAAAVASATAVALDRAGIGGGSELLALVFLTIAATVLLAGVTSAPVARLLGQRLPGREGVAILGAQGLGLLLGRELRESGSPVVFLDSNPQSCRRAEEEKFTVVYGNALQERTMQRARIDTVGTVIGLTSNQMLNSVFVSRARERFRVPRALVAVESLARGLAPELVQSGDVRVLFDGPHDVERWEVRSRHNDVLLERWRFDAVPTAEEDAEEVSPEVAEKPNARTADPFTLVAVRRGERTVPMQRGWQFKAGDRVSVAVHREEREQAHQALRELGLEPHEEEPAAEAQEG